MPAEPQQVYIVFLCIEMEDEGMFMAQKRPKASGFQSGAWTGACFGLAAASLVVGFSTTGFRNP